MVEAVGTAIGWENVHAMKDPHEGGRAEQRPQRDGGKGERGGDTNKGNGRPDKAGGQGRERHAGHKPFDVANEGKVVMIVPREYAEDALRAMRSTDRGKDAAVIGEVIGEYRGGKVLVETGIGGKRFLEPPPAGDPPVPRVC